MRNYSIFNRLSVLHLSSLFIVFFLGVISDINQPLKISIALLVIVVLGIAFVVMLNKMSTALISLITRLEHVSNGDLGEQESENSGPKTSTVITAAVKDASAIDQERIKQKFSRFKQTWSEDILVKNDATFLPQRLEQVSGQMDRQQDSQGIVSTLFERKGDNLVRVSTSVRDGFGKRALGTQLLHGLPAYSEIMLGNDFIGNVRLFGYSYVCYYKPMFDAQQKVCGAWFVGAKPTPPIIKNEMLRFEHGLHNLKSGYHSIIGQLVDLVSNSTENADALAASAEASSQVAQQQRLSAEGVSKTSHKMGESTAKLQQLALNGQEVSSQAEKEAFGSQALIGTVLDSVSNFSEKMGSISQTVVNLAAESDDMNVVLKMINELTDQIGLLALNAAIEAARAGEQGRGFAVVADEVRTLSDRTRESAEKIQSSVKKVQSLATEAESVITTERKEMQARLEKAQDASQALQTITEAVKSLGILNTDYVSSVQEQSALTDSITAVINDIVQSSRHNESSAASTSQTAQKVSELSEELRTVVAQFKL